MPIGRELRQQFLIPADEVYLNNGTVGSSPGPVLRAIFEGYEACEKLNEADPEDYPIWGYASWNQFRDPLAAFVGCDRDEIALLRNATEANSYIANGVDFEARRRSPDDRSGTSRRRDALATACQTLRHRRKESHASESR